jgi:hypothetical protein
MSNEVNSIMERRKEIHELIALYTLEPRLRDIYVEGTYDKVLIDWFLIDQHIEGICVYSVDAINVPNELLTRHGLNADCNRSRVIALSKELVANLPEGLKILCVADRDHEDYLPSGHGNCYLEFTDYTSADLYLWRNRTMQKLLSLVLGGFQMSADHIMADIVGILQEVFLLRLTNIALDWNMKWIPFMKYVQIRENITFSSGSFCEAYLRKNGKWPRRSEFDHKLADLRADLKEDPRRCIRGHDLIDLLYYAVKKLRKSRGFNNVETFQGAFTGCLEAQDIRDEMLFQRVSAL